MYIYIYIYININIFVFEYIYICIYINIYIKQRDIRQVLLIFIVAYYYNFTKIYILDKL